ncbi:MAG: CAP domain-containing protein [Halobacteria archaeon]
MYRKVVGVAFAAVLLAILASSVLGIDISREGLIDLDPELDDAEVQNQVYRELGGERKNRSDETLSRSKPLEMMAEANATEMASAEYVGHGNMSGYGATLRAFDHGYECKGHGVGENAAKMYYRKSFQGEGGNRIYSTPRELGEGVVDSWMESEGHREIVLSARYSDVGVGSQITG